MKTILKVSRQYRKTDLNVVFEVFEDLSAIYTVSGVAYGQVINSTVEFERWDDVDIINQIFPGNFLCPVSFPKPVLTTVVTANSTVTKVNTTLVDTTVVTKQVTSTTPVINTKTTLF